MVFSSTTFLFLFLPVVTLVYYLIGALTRSTAVKNGILLLASLVFYAWGEPVCVLLILISILFNYFAGRDLAAAKDAGKETRAKGVFLYTVAFNLLLLGFFKYAGFVTETLIGIGLPAPRLSLPLPVGVSFYTFQILSYVIDLYRGRIPVQKSLPSFALYVTLFPQLIAGPIVKYRDVAAQLTERRESLYRFSRGLTRFTLGLAKKLLLANPLGAVFADVQAQDGFGALSAWTGVLCYALQIYFDFSGYSDMAIGLGGMFGFRFNENFRYPYTAISVTDFWRRWHISLSGWFRDYVYIPLGGSRRGTAVTIRNLLVVWLLTGLWHGAAWNFILWGVYYGVLLILEKFVFRRVLDRLPKPLRRLLTLLAVALGWVLFSAPSLSGAVSYLAALSGADGLLDGGAVYRLVSAAPLMLLGALCATPLFRRLTLRVAPKTADRLRAAGYPLLMLLCVIFMISDTYNPFLYFRF